MASSFSTPSQEQLLAAAVADFRRRLTAYDISEGSEAWLRQVITAGMVAGLHAHLEVVYDDLLPDSCADSLLPRWGAVLNLAQKQPTPASKAAALRCYGSPGSTISPGSQLAHKDGTLYQTNSTATVAGGGTYVDVDVLAISTGSITRKQAGEQLTFVSVPTGFQSVAVLQLNMDVGGDDLEAPGDYRLRILNHLAQPPAGGNRNDYVQWGLEQAGVASAYVFPLRQGLGSVDLACLHSGRGAARLLSAGEISVVKAAIDGLRPVSVADFRVLTVTSLAQDVELQVEAENESQYQWDWDDTGGWTAASSGAWNGTTRTLKFSAALPPDVKIGSRIIAKTAASEGTQMVVEAIAASDSVIITAASVPSVAPANNDALYSGGPLVDPIRAAILTLFDALGPARGAYASGVWEDTLRTATLFFLAQGVDGVQDTTLVVPNANVVPDNTAPNSSIQLLIPRRVLVRRA